MGSNPDEVPFLHTPNMKDDDKKNGLLCFKDQNRECGAACMAFETYPSDDPDYRGKQWAHCLLLVAEHRSSKHLVIIAAQLTKHVKSQEVAKADAKRLSQAVLAPPPNTGVR